MYGVNQIDFKRQPKAYIDLFWRAEQFPHRFKIIRPTENWRNAYFESKNAFFWLFGDFSSFFVTMVGSRSMKIDSNLPKVFSFLKKWFTKQSKLVFLVAKCQQIWKFFHWFNRLYYRRMVRGLLTYKHVERRQGSMKNGNVNTWNGTHLGNIFGGIDRLY